MCGPNRPPIVIRWIGVGRCINGTAAANCHVIWRPGGRSLGATTRVGLVRRIVSSSCPARSGQCESDAIDRGVAVGVGGVFSPVRLRDGVGNAVDILGKNKIQLVVGEGIYINT